MGTDAMNMKRKIQFMLLRLQMRRRHRRRSRGYEIDMCNGPILSKMLLFSIPLMCSSILQLLFNAADIVVVGRWAGDNSLAAVGSNTALIGLLTNLFVGLAVGANTLAAKYYGARDREALRKTVHTSMLLSLLSGLLLTLVGVIGARTILVWMQTPANVLDLAALYLRIYFLGMPATMIYNFGAALLRAEGDTRRPLYFLTLAGIVNIILNLFFVIVMKLDVAGVAIATVISQCISAALVVRCMVKDSGPLHLDLRQLHIYKDSLEQILRIGLPAGFQGILFSLSNVVIQSSVNTFGEIIMAGNSAAANIEQFVYVAMNALYQATISFGQSKLRCRQLPPHPPDRYPGPALRTGSGPASGQRRLALRQHPAGHILPQRCRHSGRPGTSWYLLPYLRPVRRYGRDGGRPSGHRLFRHAHDRVPGGGLRPAASVDRHHLPDPAIPHDSDALLVLSHLLGHHRRGTYPLLPVGHEAGPPALLPGRGDTSEPRLLKTVHRKPAPDFVRRRFLFPFTGPAIPLRTARHRRTASASPPPWPQARE